MQEAPRSGAKRARASAQALEERVQQEARPTQRDYAGLMVAGLETLAAAYIELAMAETNHLVTQLKKGASKKIRFDALLEVWFQRLNKTTGAICANSTAGLGACRETGLWLGLDIY